MASLKPRKLRTGIGWRIRYHLDGKAVEEYIPVGTSEKTARAVLVEFEYRLSRHKLDIEDFKSPLKKSIDSDNMTITQYRDWFLNNKKTAKGRGTPIAPKSVEVYNRAFNLLLDTTGNIQIKQLQRHFPELEEKLNRYSPNSRSIVVRALRAAWNFGITRDILKNNPFKKIEAGTVKTHPDILSPKEKDLIYSKIKDPEIQKAFLIARYTGLRRAEIQKLHWDHVVWDGNIIVIPEGKEAENEVVPMIPILKRQLRPFKQDEGLIVNRHPDTITHYIGKAKKSAKIKKHGSVHILRHSLATDLIEQDVDIRIVQMILRHASITTTQIYTHLTTSKLLKEMKYKRI